MSGPLVVHSTGTGHALVFKFNRHDHGIDDDQHANGDLLT